ILVVVIGLIVLAFLYFRSLPKKVTVDFYGTATQAKSIEVENSLIFLAEKFGKNLDLSLHLVAAKNDKGELLSYYQDTQDATVGQIDLAEDKIQLVIQDLYPNLFLPYLELRNQNIGDTDAEKYMRVLGIDTTKIQKAIEDKEGERLLEKETEKFVALKIEKGIETIPAILINGQVYQGDISTLSLGAAIAKPMLRGNKDSLKETVRINLGESVSITMPWDRKSVGGIYECYNNADCNDKEGQIGVCKNINTKEAFCRYEAPAEVDLLIISDEKCVSCHTDEAVGLLEKDFKGLKAKVIDLDTPEAREMIEKYQIKSLPVFVFEQNVEKSQNFSRYISNSYLVKLAGDKNQYLLTQTETRKILDREPQERKINLFVNAYNPSSIAIENALIKKKKQLEAEGKPSFDLEINHVLLTEQDEQGNLKVKIDTPAGINETEETVRQVVIAKYYPDKYLDYLLKRNENLERDFEEIMNEIGIDAAQVEFSTKNEGEGLTRDNAQLAFDLQISALPVFLWENQVIVLSMDDLGELDFFSGLEIDQ
ncbi:hypothetical protein KKC60_04195, partial [Patescibacteria group bacterium]|nr:hypothetical protein [Patescibacteria group bacterium]